PLVPEPLPASPGRLTVYTAGLSRSSNPSTPGRAWRRCPPGWVLCRPERLECPGEHHSEENIVMAPCLEVGARPGPPTFPGSRPTAQGKLCGITGGRIGLVGVPTRSVFCPSTMPMKPPLMPMMLPPPDWNAPTRSGPTCPGPVARLPATTQVVSLAEPPLGR